MQQLILALQFMHPVLTATAYFRFKQLISKLKEHDVMNGMLNEELAGTIIQSLN